MTNLVTFAKEPAALAAAKAIGLTDAEAAQVVSQPAASLTWQVDHDLAERLLVARLSEHHRTVETPHFNATKIDTSEDLDNIQATGYSHCPHCGIHLGNGVTDFDGMVDSHGSEREALKLMSHEWSCLGCNGEWGAAVGKKASKGHPASLRVYTNKSDAELVKPKGGAVVVCWDIFAASPDMKRKDAIQAAVDAGVAFYTARTQYQKWFTASKASR